jgi:hypothetical protein
MEFGCLPTWNFLDRALSCIGNPRSTPLKKLLPAFFFPFAHYFFATMLTATRALRASSCRTGIYAVSADIVLDGGCTSHLLV